jgi:SAM-dependent methyltransferase
MKEEFYKKMIEDAYDSDKDHLESYRIVGLWGPEKKLIKQFFPQSGDILDIGCGAGRTTIPIKQLGYNVCGIDLSPGMIKAAREQSAEHGLDIDFYEMNAKSLSFADQSVDGVLFSFNGIDHVSGYADKVEVMREIARVLRPGGSFIFSVHRIWCPNHLPSLIMSGLKTSFWKIMGNSRSNQEWGEFYDDLGYMSFMTPIRWEQALNTAGLDLVFRQSRFKLEFNNSWKRLRYVINGNFLFHVARKP